MAVASAKDAESDSEEVASVKSMTIGSLLLTDAEESIEEEPSSNRMANSQLSPGSLWWSGAVVAFATGSKFCCRAASQSPSPSRKIFGKAINVG